jgi:hypothetical protein
MSIHTRHLGSALLALAGFVSAAGAQDFMNSYPRTIPQGNFELTAHPTLLVGRDNGPDRWGVAGRFGYGVTNSLDLVAKGGAFDDFGLLGFAANYWVLKGGGLDLAVNAGAHKALIENANDTTALDLGLQLGGRVGERLDLSGGLSASFESIDDAPEGLDSDFTRLYVGPGVRYRVTRSLDLLGQAGIGLTDDSPHYFSLGFAAYFPTSGGARREDR